MTATPETSVRPPKLMIVVTLLVIAAFALPLIEVAMFALQSDIFSHILLIPFIVGYLLYTSKQPWLFRSKPSIGMALIPLLLGVAILSGYFYAKSSGWSPGIEDRLAALILAFACCVFSIAAAFLPRPCLREAAFPLILLVFLAPFPAVLIHGLEAFLQHRSADAAELLFRMSQMPYVREDTLFRLPGISLEVAPECSGIRSTLALFVTSLVAAHMLLRSPVRKTLLVGFVIPLALLRNGFRIFTIGQLCVQVSPDMVHSFIHRRGGPIFFALSLVPFVLLLLWFRWMETKRRRS